MDSPKISRSSTSSNSSNKRKSFTSQDENSCPNYELNQGNDENKNLNCITVSAKKTRLKDLVLIDDGKKIDNIDGILANESIQNPVKISIGSVSGMKTRSGLPRYQAMKLKKISTHNSKDKLRDESDSFAKVKRLSLKNYSSASYDKSYQQSAIIQQLKKYSAGLQMSQIVAADFEKAITLGEDKISTIVGSLKSKSSKWDYKDKMKKQESVIKELRDGSMAMVREFQSLRESCVTKSNEVDQLIKDASDELIEMTQRVQVYHNIEKKLKKEISKCEEEGKSQDLTIKALKASKQSMETQINQFTTQLQSMTQKFSNEEDLRILSESELLRIQREYSEIKSKHEVEIHQLHETYQQKLEAAQQNLSSEINLNKGELEKRAVDLEKLQIEKGEWEKKRIELHEELVLTQSRLREADHVVQRLEHEAVKQSADWEQLKQQCALKDADLRSTLSSLHEIQRQSMGEKNGLKSDLMALQHRVQTLEDERLTLSSQLAAKKEELLACTRDCMQLRENYYNLEIKFAAKELEAAEAKDAMKLLDLERELRCKSEVREEAERRERIAAVAHLMAIQTECHNKMAAIEEKKEGIIQNLEENLKVCNVTVEEGRREVHRLTDLVTGLEKEVQQLHSALETASTNHESLEELGRVTGELERLRKRVKDLTECQEHQGQVDTQKFHEYEEKLRAGESQRRKLHNIIQELRGNVRVFARVRPYLPNDGLDLTIMQNSETAGPSPTIIVQPDTSSLRIFRDGNGDFQRSEDHSFSFDKVFGPSSSQEVVFQEVSEFVQSALDGYNVCLFSYGQTGSGKTHTMQGSGTGSMRGIIPRAMEQVGLYKSELELKGWEYHMEISFVEIYNETIRDLLRNSNSMMTSANVEELKHEIKKDPNGNTYVSDVTMVTVDPNDNEQVKGIMELAARHRSVGQTAMNERSSRSHSIFNLHLKASHRIQGITLRGILSLVDLAGSERLDRSLATGTQLKETFAINKSLSALADVFVAISNKQSHIPFRNSKLTYLLQPALSGDGKTLMLVNLSPTEESFNESLCSLRLAKQVNQCELGKPKRQLKEAASPMVHGTSSVSATAPAGLSTSLTPCSSQGMSQSLTVGTMKRTGIPNSSTSRSGSISSNSTSSTSVSQMSATETPSVPSTKRCITPNSKSTNSKNPNKK